MGINHLGTGGGPDSFTSLGIVDLLQADARPTFAVVAKHGDCRNMERLRPVFSNNALNNCVALKAHLFDDPDRIPTLPAFISWIRSATRSGVSTYNYVDTEWCCTQVVGSWLVISATRVVSLSPHDSPSYLIGHPARSPSTSGFDWTQTTEPVECPEYVSFVRAWDWSSTSVGSMSTWPSELRLAFNVIMRSERPQALYWGKDMTVIYNSSSRSFHFSF